MKIDRKNLIEKVLSSNVPFANEIVFLLGTLKIDYIEFNEVKNNEIFDIKFQSLYHLIPHKPKDIAYQEKYCKNNLEFSETGYFSYFEVDNGRHVLGPGLDKDLNLVFCVIHPYALKYIDSRKSITDRINNAGVLKRKFSFFKK